MTIPQRVIDLFRKRFGGDPDGIARAPGRVNLLGEHVDYNDGFVLPAAIDQASYVAFRLSGDDRTTLLPMDFSDEITWDANSIDRKVNDSGQPLPSWALYPAGVAWALTRAGQRTPGIQAVYASNIPIGSGLSSSASIELAFCVVWQEVAGGTLHAIDMARLCQHAENKYVGINCGIMDQFASACGEAGYALLLDCRSLDWRSLPLPTNVSIVIADTSVRRTLKNSAYNDRRASCEEAVRLLSRALPGIRALRDVKVEDFFRFSGLLPQEVKQRAQYVVEEMERMRIAPALLESGNIRAFGELMNQCHAGLRDLYEVSCPELDGMAAIAQSLPGCIGARMTGGGFGGCTVNLVEQSDVEDFSKELSAEYERRFGKHAEIYVCLPSGGAGMMKM